MKIKKITALLLGLCGAFVFAACKDEPATTNDDTPTTTPAPAHTHTFATEWSKDETHHWYACTGSGCKDVSEKAEHVFDGGEITTPATATQEGVKTFTCETCGATKTEPVEYVPDTEVTAEEWAIAMELNFDNYTMTQEMKYGEETQRVATMVDDGLIYHNGEQELYLTKEGDVYYEYVCEENEWHKYSVTESYYNGYADASLASGFIFEDFTYNAETKAYECETASVQGITNATLTFSDNRLVSATFTMGPVQASMTLSYGDAEITLPQTVPSKKIKSDDMLANAFSAAFAIRDNGEYAVGVDSLKDMTYIEAGGYYTYTVYNKELNLQADYQAHFLDGKLVKLEVFIDGVKTYVFTYDYEVEEIKIPEV